MLYYTLYHPKCLLVSKNTFPDFGITRIGHLRAQIQQIIEIWWPFWIMQIRCFPILGFLRTFSMVFWGPHRNSLWQKKLCCNLFQVKPYFAWTIPQFHSNHRVNSSTPRYCQSATFGRLTFCVYPLIFFLRNSRLMSPCPPRARHIHRANRSAAS